MSLPEMYGNCVPLVVFGGRRSDAARIKGRSRSRSRPGSLSTCRTADRESLGICAASDVSRFCFGLIEAREAVKSTNYSIKPALPTCRCTALSPSKEGRECESDGGNRDTPNHNLDRCVLMKTWTKADQLAAYGRAQEILRGERYEGVSRYKREEAVQAAFLRWLEESDGEPIDIWVKRAVAAAGRESRKRKTEVEFTDEVYAAALTVEAAPMEDWIDAKRQFRASLPEARTTQVSVKGEFVPIAEADLELEQLERDRSELAARYELAVNRNPKDTRLRASATVLRALTCKDFDVSGIAGKASAWLTSQNRGPRTRAQEADALIGCVRYRDSERVVRLLRASPLVAADTRVPAPGRPWADVERERAEQAVAVVLATTINDQPAAVAKGVLVALGCSASKAKGLDEHLRKRAARSKPAA